MKRLILGALAIIAGAGSTPAPAQNLTVSTAISRNYQSATRLAIPSYYQFLDDEFDGAAGYVLARPNWTAPEFGAAADPPVANNDPNWFKVITQTVGGTPLDYLYDSSSSKNTSTHATLYYGASALASTSDIKIDFGYDVSGLNGTGGTTATPTLTNLHFWQTDANNYLELQTDTQNHRVAITGKLAGTAITGQYWKLRDSGNVSYLSRGNLHVEIRGNFMRMSLDGVWLNTANNWPFDVLNLTTLSGNLIGAGVNHGAIGMLQSATNTALAQYIRVIPQDVQIAFNDQFVGRDSTTATGGSGRLEFTYTGTPVTWVGRLLDQTTGAVLVDWARLKNGQQCGSTYTSMIGQTTPTEVSGAGTYCAQIFEPLRNGVYTIEAGFIGSDGKLHTALSRASVSGYKVQFYGQSTSNGRAGTGSVAFVGTVSGNGGIWQQCPTSTFMPCQTITAGAGVKGQSRQFGGAWTDFPKTGFGNAYLAAQYASGVLGAPVGITVAGTDGTSILDLSGAPGESNNNSYTDWLSGNNYSPGICELGLWDQGQADADIATSSNSVNYGSTFVTYLLPRWRAQCNNPNMPVLISMIGRYATTGTTTGTTATTIVNPFRENVRQGYLYAITNDPIGKTSFSDTDLGVPHPWTGQVHNGVTDTTTDAYHYGAFGSEAEINRRAGYSIAKALGASIYDGRGPIITSATRSGAVITLHLDMNGAATLYFANQHLGQTGQVPAAQTNTLYGYQVSANGFTSNLPISSIAVGADNVTIVITLASDPGGPVQVRSYYGSDYDDNNLFWGTGYSDGRADLPVFKLFNDGSNLPNHPMTTSS